MKSGATQTGQFSADRIRSHALLAVRSIKDELGELSCDWDEKRQIIVVDAVKVHEAWPGRAQLGIQTNMVSGVSDALLKLGQDHFIQCPTVDYRDKQLECLESAQKCGCHILVTARSKYDLDDPIGFETHHLKVAHEANMKFGEGVCYYDYPSERIVVTEERIADLMIGAKSWDEVRLEVRAVCDFLIRYNAKYMILISRGSYDREEEYPA